MAANVIISIFLIVKPINIKTTNVKITHPSCQNITIPAIKLKVPIKTKLTEKNMRENVCLEKPDTYPGMKGNLIIAGHNYQDDKLFSNLDQLKIGNKIIINHTYVYRIDNIQAIKDNHHFKNSKQAKIILYTCLRHNNPDYRLAVYGHLINNTRK